jgi:hypothetical protein
LRRSSKPVRDQIQVSDALCGYGERRGELTDAHLPRPDPNSRDGPIVVDLQLLGGRELLLLRLFKGSPTSKNLEQGDLGERRTRARRSAASSGRRRMFWTHSERPDVAGSLVVLDAASSGGGEVLGGAPRDSGEEGFGRRRGIPFLITLMKKVPSGIDNGVEKSGGD